MKTYDQVVATVANTLVTAGVDRSQSFGFYLSDSQIAYLFDKDTEVVEMDMQLAKQDQYKRLTRAFA
jgi:hypothetical protein